MFKFALVLLFLVSFSHATVYFKETFGPDYSKNWVVSDWKKSDGTAGTWKHTAGEFYGDKEEDKGIQTGEDARFYAISSKFDKPFSNAGKDLVLQYQVRHPQQIDCGGGYIKLMPHKTNQKNFNGDSEYFIMFGPDICGTTTRKTHVIFNYKGKNHLIKKDVRTESDQMSHVYTLIVRPDNTYEVRIDRVKVESGSLGDDWDMLPPKTIKDPTKSKPSDWVDEAKMADPNDKKPEGYDKVPAKIADPNASMPDDWDEESDGKWEAPQIDNPDYKGEWKAKMIDNPDYKGAWVHPMIPNPDFADDKNLYKYDGIGAVGFEIWQVKAGSIFDNIIVTDSIDEAEAFIAETWTKNKVGEKAMFDAQAKAKADAEMESKKNNDEQRKKQDAEKRAAEAEEEDDEDEDEDDEGVDAVKSKKAGKDEL